MSDIRIITEPSVRLVGRQSIDEEALADFLQDEGVESWETDTDIAGQKLVEVAGRLCYKSYAKPRPGGNAAYIGHILEVGHGSVIEHAVYSFIITGVSRSFTHELVRHRAGWAYSQRSQRFCDEAGFSAVVPLALADEVAAGMALIREGWPNATKIGGCAECLLRDTAFGITDEETAGLQWIMATDSANEVYGQLSDYLTRKTIKIHFPQDKVETLEQARDWLVHHKDQATGFRKKAREAARSILPNCTETQIFVTANARALRNFLEQRGSREADAEIRRVAVAICNIMKREAPELFADFLVVGDENSVICLANSYKKV